MEWTEGRRVDLAFSPLEGLDCRLIALTDEQIEELWRVTPDGTTVEIRP